MFRFMAQNVHYVDSQERKGFSYAPDDTTRGRKAANFGGPQSHQLADLWPEGGGSVVGHRPREAAVSNAQVRTETTKSYFVNASPMASISSSLRERSVAEMIPSRSVKGRVGCATSPTLAVRWRTPTVRSRTVERSSKRPILPDFERQIKIILLL